eukprot:1160396-Pelagomonas_calceolata.AAC.1
MAEITTIHQPLVGFTPQLIWHVCPNWQFTNPSARKPKPEELKLNNCQLGHTYAGSMKKTGNFRPQLTPSGKDPVADQKDNVSYIQNAYEASRRVSVRKEQSKIEVQATCRFLKEIDDLFYSIASVTLGVCNCRQDPVQVVEFKQSQWRRMIDPYFGLGWKDPRPTPTFRWGPSSPHRHTDMGAPSPKLLTRIVPEEHKEQICIKDCALEAPAGSDNFGRDFNNGSLHIIIAYTFHLTGSLYGLSLEFEGATGPQLADSQWPPQLPSTPDCG